MDDLQFGKKMDGAILRKICKERDLFETPDLNSSLLLHHKGFSKIENLEEYTEVRTLYLQSNVLAHIENLDKLSKLKCLFLHQNCITHISGLEHLHDLIQLDLSSNRIKKIENLGNCGKLERLNLSDNYLQSLDSIRGLYECKSLINVDISKNYIEDMEMLPEEFSREMTQAVCLYLHGNPGIRSIKNYRKTIINALPNLVYLDERPVKELERIAAAAWGQGGREAEMKARADFSRAEEERLTGIIKGNREAQEAYRMKMCRALARIDREEAERQLRMAGDHTIADAVRRLSTVSTCSQVSYTTLSSMD